MRHKEQVSLRAGDEECNVVTPGNNDDKYSSNNNDNNGDINNNNENDNKNSYTLRRII